MARVNNRPGFAYAQARIQARHGQRATATDWRRLASARDLESFLQAAQHTPLRPWTQGLQVVPSSHAIELQLRQRFRHHVDEVATWLPLPWRSSLQWVKHLPDLPALQYLLSTESAPAWMRDDPVLQPFATVAGNARHEAFQATELVSLQTAWQHGGSLPLAWLEQWRRRWPKSKSQQEGLVYLGVLMQRFLSNVQAAVTGKRDNPQTSLISGLQYAFRRYSFQPAAACAHLGLVAVDLQRLRGELLQRVLFDERMVEQT